MKKIFFYGFFLLSIVLSAQESNTDKNYITEIELTHSAEDAWKLITDVSQWKQWDSHIVDAQLKGDFVDNAKGNLVTTNSDVISFQIVDFKEGESYTVRHKLSSGTVHLKRSIAATEAGSKVRVEVWFKRLSLRNFKKYMGNNYTAIQKSELQNFTQLLKN